MTSTNTLIESKFCLDTQTIEYTTIGTNAKTIIDKFTATNVTAAAATITVNIVPSGGTADNSNKITSVKSLAANESYTFPELIGHVLNEGVTISVIASTATSIVIRSSGRIIT